MFVGDIMNIDISSLKSGVLNKLEINEDCNIDKGLLDQTDLLELKNIVVSGNLFLDSLGDYQISLDIGGVMVLPCAITLKPVYYPFNIEVDGNVFDLLDEIDENSKKFENTIDIFPIIWENILMEIPLRVVAEDAKEVTMAGDGWKFVTDLETKGTTNSELEKLKDLL